MGTGAESGAEPNLLHRESVGAMGAELVSAKKHGALKRDAFFDQQEGGTTLAHEGNCAQHDARDSQPQFFPEYGNLTTSGNEDPMVTLVFEVMANCDRNSREAFPIFRPYFLRSLEAPVMPDAAMGYTKAMKCWNNSASMGDALPSPFERFLTLVKLGGKDFMGQAEFNRVYSNLDPAQKRKVRDTLKNHETQKANNPRDAFNLRLDETILVRWFPCLLWLMDDHSAAQMLRESEIKRDGKSVLPFEDLNGEAYARARQRLQQKGLISWTAFYSKPPCTFAKTDGSFLTFEKPEDCGGFDYLPERA